MAAGGGSAAYKAYAGELARKYHLKYFVPQIQQESGFQLGLTSKAGAQGIAQIMPDTAAGWGVDPNDPKAALEAAARNMAKYVKQYGSEKNALIAYNAGPAAVGKPLPAETQQYLKIIMGDQGSSQAPDATRDASFDVTGGTIPGATQAQPKQPSVYDVIARYREATQPQPLAGGLGLQGIGQYDPVASGNRIQQMTQQLLDLRSKPVESPTAPVGTAPVGGTLSGGTATGPGGAVKIIGGNPGRLKPGVVSFAEKLAGRLGRTLEIDSGASHSKFTVDGNISEHYTGDATDIPMSGKQLTQAGQQALIEAGMDPAKAHQIQGGLYNITTPDGGRYQIIFNTMQGGNHYTHLHVGYRPGKK